MGFLLPFEGCLPPMPTVNNCIDFVIPQCTSDCNIFPGLLSGSPWYFPEDPRSWTCQSSFSGRSLHNFQALCPRTCPVWKYGGWLCRHNLTLLIQEHLCPAILFLKWRYLLLWLCSCLEPEVSPFPSPFQFLLAKRDRPLSNPEHNRLVHPEQWAWTCRRWGNQVLRCSFPKCWSCQHRHKKEQENLGGNCEYFTKTERTWSQSARRVDQVRGVLAWLYQVWLWEKDMNIKIIL